MLFWTKVKDDHTSLSQEGWLNRFCISDVQKKEVITKLVGRAPVFDAVPPEKTPQRRLNALSPSCWKAPKCLEAVCAVTESKEALLVLVNAVDIALEQAKCRVEPPNDLPV
jgi:hypothetical protein